MNIDYKDLFEYRDGSLYWKAKTSPTVRIEIGDKAGTTRPDGYVAIKVYGQKYLAHRVIWEMFNGVIPKGKVIDHINNNSDDNRIENLQCISQKKNIERVDKLSGFCYRKDNNSWTSYKNYNTKRYNLGSFGTACGAYLANRMFFIGGHNV